MADTYWSNANLFKGVQVYDSAYYYYNEAYKYFEAIDHQYNAAKMLYGMAFIKGRFRDYIGSEILMVRAIEKYKKLEKYKALFAAYEHLGILQKEIGEYDRALFYYNEALHYADKFEEGKFPKYAGFNNIALVYQNMGAYDKAEMYFDKILDNDRLIVENAARYARVLDNKAYNRLLSGDTTKVEQDFFISLNIRDSLRNKEGLSISNIHLAEYYLKFGDITKAKLRAQEANHYASEVGNYRDYLTSLQLLAKTDRVNSRAYLNRYIAVNDSLQDADRRIQNKFTRIAYETDEYIEETKRLSLQKIVILVGAFIIILIISLVYYIIVQRSRNERLLLETEQQKANEQVYILTLKQQVKLEEEKAKERNRISQELHDGILGKLFGIRVDLGFLDIKGAPETLKKHELFLEELHRIETEIREVSHRLNADFNGSEIDFSAVLSQLLENKGRIGHFKHQLFIEENIEWITMNEMVKVNLYRIIQEALQNVVRHSKAQLVYLAVTMDQNNLNVTLNDDGAGFDVKKRKRGIGLKNMKTRVEKFNGTFNTQSGIGTGTTITFTIPIC